MIVIHTFFHTYLCAILHCDNILDSVCILNNFLISSSFEFMLDPALSMDTSEAIRSTRDKLVDTQQQIVSCSGGGDSGVKSSGGGMSSADEKIKENK